MGLFFKNSREASTDYDAVFSPRLNALINAALQDGVLTDKERSIILKRAKVEGEDVDEVEMIINARLAEMKRCHVNYNSREDQQEITPQDFVLPSIEPDANKKSVVVTSNQRGGLYRAESMKESPQMADFHYSTRDAYISPIDKYPSELKAIMNLAASDGIGNELNNEHKKTLLTAAKKYPEVDPYQLLIDADAVKKEYYYCKELGYASIYKDVAVEKHIMEAKLYCPDNPKVIKAIQIAEHVLEARKKERG